mgnify:CR=1 FL=1
MNFSKGDVVLLPFPFSDLTSMKVRPAIVVGINPYGDVLLVPVTSNSQNVDLSLVNWREAGLNVACGIKAQIATIEVSLIRKNIGHLSADDLAGLNTRLRDWLQL